MYNSLFMLILLSCGAFAQDIDTVAVQDEFYSDLDLPNRPCALTSNNLPFIDSIEYGEHKINQGNKEYYLMVYDKNGILRKEGVFWDAYPSGPYKQYNRLGQLELEGNYSLKRYEQPMSYTCTFYNENSQTSTFEYLTNYISVKEGKWNQYGVSGKILKIEVFDHQNATKTVHQFDRTGRQFKTLIFVKGKLEETIDL